MVVLDEVGGSATISIGVQGGDKAGTFTLLFFIRCVMRLLDSLWQL